MVKLLGFVRCDVDQAIFFRREGDSLIIVLVHVEDCTIAATSQPLIIRFKIEIARHVDIRRRDFGEYPGVLQPPLSSLIDELSSITLRWRYSTYPKL